MLATTDSSLRGLRDRAMLLLAYDLSARQSELVAIHVEHLLETTGGNGIATIARSKTDQFAAGARAFVARETLQAIAAWREAAGITNGAVFRAVDRWGNVGNRLGSRQLEYCLKRLAARAALGSGWSGHSPRVGAAQEMVSAGFNIAGVLQAQRRASADSLRPYLEDIEANRSAMAMLAERQGRT